jgi:hypothetical protein
MIGGVWEYASTSVKIYIFDSTCNLNPGCARRFATTSSAKPRANCIGLNDRRWSAVTPSLLIAA